MLCIFWYIYVHAHRSMCNIFMSAQIIDFDSRNKCWKATLIISRVRILPWMVEGQRFYFSSWPVHTDTLILGSSDNSDTNNPIFSDGYYASMKILFMDTSVYLCECLLENSWVKKKKNVNHGMRKKLTSVFSLVTQTASSLHVWYFS